MGGREGAPLVLLTSSCGSKRASVGRSDVVSHSLNPFLPSPSAMVGRQSLLGMGPLLPFPFLT